MFARQKDQKREQINARHAIMSCFDSRDLIKLALPSSNQADLRNLDKVDPRRLSADFANDKDRLLAEVLTNPDIQAKQIQGKNISISALLRLFEKAVEDINVNDHIDFARLWNACLEQEAEVALLHAQDFINEQTKNLKSSELNSTNLLIQLNFIRQEAISIFQPVLAMAQSKRDNEVIITVIQKFELYMQ